jgi:hypothetical protein
LKRLVTSRRTGRGLGQKPKASIHALGDLGGAENRQARRSEFNGEGYAIETLADLGDDRQELLGQPEASVAGRGPDTEQADRLRLQSRSHRGTVARPGERQRSQGLGALGHDPELLLAGGE